MYRAREGQRSDVNYAARASVARYGRMSSDSADDFRNTGELESLAIPTGLYIDYLPWHVRVLEGDVLLGRTGLYGWDGKQYDNGVVLAPRVEPDKSVLDLVEWLAGASTGVLVAGGTLLLVGFAASEVLSAGTATPLWLATVGVGSAVVTGIALGVGAMALGAEIGSRIGSGQTTGQVIGGTLAGLTGVGGVYTGLTGRDIATEQDLGLNSFNRGMAFGTGLVQAAATVAGGYGLVRAGVAWTRQFAATAAAWQTATGEELAGAAGRQLGLGRLLASGKAMSMGGAAGLRTTANRGVTRQSLIRMLMGHTAYADDLAAGIDRGIIELNVLGEDLFARAYALKGGNPRAVPWGFAQAESIYVRQNSASLLSDIVHEGTHAMDFRYRTILSPGGFLWENHAYYRAREFQLAGGGPVDFATLELMLHHIWTNY